MSMSVNKIMKKLSEIELESHDVELGVVQDEVNRIKVAQKEFEDGFLIVSFARQKAIPVIKASIEKAVKFKAKFEESKKAAKELGVDLPKEYLDLDQKAGVLIGEANDIIDWLNKY